MNKIPFSVLISVYAGDQDIYFDEALKSITIDQELKPTQVLLVVDGPINVEKNKIISKYQNEDNIEFDVIWLKENVGQGEALNAGLLKCKYNYVARMDSDDISLSSRFKVQMSYLKENPSVDLLSSFVEEFNDEGLKAVRCLPVLYEDIIRYGKSRSPINHGCCIFKKNRVLEAGGYSAYVQVQDYLLFAKMINLGCELRNTPDILLRARMPGGYVKKAGVSYFKEEVLLAINFYKMGYIGMLGLFKNILVRAVPRLLNQRLINVIYKYALR